MSKQSSSTGADVLQELFEVIESRKGADPESSYSARLFADGREKIARKLNEESLEALVAALNETPDRLVCESADVLYHLMVLWADVGITPDQVWQELANRGGTSGIEEKRTRKS